jgi:hypothetical protein
MEQTVSNLYLIEKVTVPAFSETKFVVRASAVEGGTMSPGNGIATGSVHFSNRHDLHPFLNVVTKCDKDGQVRVGVMNTTMEEIVIPVGTKYGSFSRIVDVAQHSEHPFCVAVINSANRLHPLGQEEVGEPDKRERRQLPRRRLPKRLSQLTKPDQSWHPGWLGQLRRLTLRPGLPT